MGNNQQKYFDALEHAGRTGGSTPFIEFMLGVILKTIRKQTSTNVPRNVPLKRLDDILKLIKRNNQITILQLASILKVSDKTIKRDIRKLKNSHKIVRVGSLKTGHWQMLDRK